MSRIISKGSARKSSGVLSLFIIHNISFTCADFMHEISALLTKFLFFLTPPSFTKFQLNTQNENLNNLCPVILFSVRVALVLFGRFDSPGGRCLFPPK